MADDEALIRSSLRVLLNAEPDFEVCGEAADGVEAVRMARESRPDVVLMDIRMPRLDGIEATARVRAAGPDDVRVLVLTTFDHDDNVAAAIEAGAAGFVLKRSDPAELAHAVRLAASGSALVLPASARDRLLRGRTGSNRWAAALGRLTSRERQVLHLVASGRTNAEIASELYLGVQTVKTHVAAVLTKLGARDRTQAAVIAHESGFTDGSTRSTTND